MLFFLAYFLIGLLSDLSIDFFQNRPVPTARGHRKQPNPAIVLSY